MSVLQNLAGPLEQLLGLFTSIKVQSEASPSTHVESTLQILTLLMDQYDQTFINLQTAKDNISNYDSRYMMNQKRLTDFQIQTSHQLQNIRSQAVKQNEEHNHLLTELHVLRNRLACAERDRKTQEELILGMAKKLNDTEENNLILRRERKKVDMHVIQLKTQIEGKYFESLN